MIRMIQKIRDQFTSHHWYRCNTASVYKSMSDKMISALSDFYLTLCTDCDKTVPLRRQTPAELPAGTSKQPWPTCSSATTQSPCRPLSITAVTLSPLFFIFSIRKILLLFLLPLQLLLLLLLLLLPMMMMMMIIKYVNASECLFCWFLHEFVSMLMWNIDIDLR